MSESELFLDLVRRGLGEAIDRVLAEHPEMARARDAAGISAVLTATYHGHEAVARQLAQVAGPLDLHEAAALGDLPRVQALLDADPQAVDAPAADGFHPLGLAAFFGREPVVDLLLQRGADPSLAAHNHIKVAPLHSAVAHRNADVSLRVARRLLQAGAQPNAGQAGGITPLHAAAAHDRRDLARLLLEAGADPAQAAQDGRTPRDLAAASGHGQMVALLDGAAQGPAR